MKEEIEECIIKGSMNLGRLNKFLRSKNVTRQTKKQLYKTVIRPTVLYACDTWTLTRMGTEIRDLGTKNTTDDIWRSQGTRRMENKNK